MFIPLQSSSSYYPSAEDIQHAADSARVNLTKAAQEFVTNPHGFLHDLISDIIDFGLKLLGALAIYIIGIWVIRLIKKMMNKAFEKRRTDATVVSFINSLVSITLMLILLILTISALGVNTTAIAALIAAGGVAIGMALSGTLQNFAGGLMLLIFKPFKAGEYIRVQGQEGFVTEVNIFNTKIRTYTNVIVTLPNGNMSSSTIENLSRSPFRRLDWVVNVSYGNDAEKVKEALMDIVCSVPGVIVYGEQQAVPDPTVVLTAMNDSSVEFTARAWVQVADYWAVKYAVSEKIYSELPREGISFPFPQLDVHINQTGS